MNQKLSPMDNVFFQLESHDTPMHVAGLQTFHLPPDADSDFVQTLVNRLRSPTQLTAPWNLKLKRGVLGRQWQVDRDVDLDYHIRHIALPRPGGERELGAMISRLHGHGLRRHRPLWECYVIEGLTDRRFAIYTKIHHALADGIKAMRLMTESLSDTPDTSRLAPWAAARPDPAQFNEQPAQRADATDGPSLRQTSTALKAVSKGGARMLLQAWAGGEGLTLPFAAPSSVLNSKITGQRRYATQQIELARIKSIGRASQTTVNDVVLALCGAALRRFFKDANQLPDRSLTASVPVSIRAEGDQHSSNAVSIMLTSLGTHIADPLERLQYVRTSSRLGKQHLQAIPRAGQQLYNSLLLAPFVMQAVTGVAAKRRPFFNVTVSNVPGPGKALYLHRARLEAMYPVSIPTHGQALNITCSSYNGMLNIGFCGCRDALPHLQHIAVYLGEAMRELESAVGIASAPMPTATLPRVVNG